VSARLDRARPNAGWLVVTLGLLVVIAPLVGTVHGQEQGAGTFERARVGTREYRLFVPSGAGDGPLPLVLALHGCWQTPDDFARGTRLNDVAERRRLLVVYPAQSRRDNVSRCWNWFDPQQQSREQGETAEILGVLQDVQRHHQVRADRIVVLGLSAGGFMAVNLVCASPDTFVGLAVAAGGPYRCGVGVDGALACMRGSHGDPAASAAACERAGGGRWRPVKASLWQGADDAVVNPNDLDALASMLGRLDAARPGPSVAVDGAVRTVHHDAAGHPLIETWLVSGMGHAWSGGDARGSNTFPPGPDATARILDFLLPDSPERKR
jgi:poly(hydroxyalkanoate) depolymerase family esterase